jgi:probable rRNA maturation factor
LINIDNQTKVDLDLEILNKISHEYTDKDIELLIINSEDMRKINLEQRQIDKTTDVLSFPLEDFLHFPLGSIVINSDLAKMKAEELEHKTTDEITLLFIHGLLHLLGYDHECDNGEMRKEEEKIIKKYNLPKSLIVRTIE